MLGKYWSIFLLAGLGLAVLLDKRRTAYFRSAAPWITIVAGLIVLAPHLLWLFRSDFESFSYAMLVHGDETVCCHRSLPRSVYVAGVFGYIALPLIIAGAITRPGVKTLSDILWPQDIERRFVAAAFWGPLLLPTLRRWRLTPKLPHCGRCPLFRCCRCCCCRHLRPRFANSTRGAFYLAQRRCQLSCCFVSPFITIAAQRAGPAPASAQPPLLAGEVERIWYQSTPQPLRFIGGDVDLAYGVAAYAADRPRALTGMPAPPASELARSGFVWLCFAEDAVCRSQAVARGGPAAKLVETQIVRNFLRFAGKPQRYTIYVVLPQP